jgi:hypothetical protein
MYAVHDNPRPGYSVILLDVEWVETPEEFLTTMAAELLAIDRVRRVFRGLRDTPSMLARWVTGAIDEVGVGVGNVGELKIRLRQNLNSPDLLPDLATQMLGTLRNLPDRVVLILDEFPIMVSSMLERDEATALRFLRWFRTFRQSPGTDRLTFLLGGSTNIEPRLESVRAEAVLGDLQRYRIVPFDTEKAVVFVRALLTEEGMVCDPETAQEIVRTCRSGVPFYLQVTVAECLAENRRSHKELTVAGVRAIYEEHVIGPINRHRFSHYQTRLRSHYGSLEEPARAVLANLCTGPKTVDALREHLGASGHDQAILERVLVLLEGDYYIVRDGQSISFTDGLLCDWWKRNSVPPRSK